MRMGRMKSSDPCHPADGWASQKVVEVTDARLVHSHAPYTLKQLDWQAGACPTEPVLPDRVRYLFQTVAARLGAM